MTEFVGLCGGEMNIMPPSPGQLTPVKNGPEPGPAFKQLKRSEKYVRGTSSGDPFQHAEKI